MPSSPETSLFEQYGGVPAVTVLVRAFYERMMAKPSLRRYFAGLNPETVIGHQIRLMAFALGKPAEVYDISQLAVSHHKLGVTDSAFDETLAILRQVLLEANFEGRDIITVIDTVESFREWIVASAPLGEVLHKAANSDRLTGLANQNALAVALREELATAAAEPRPASFLLVSVTDLQQTVSDHGSRVADEMLRRLAKALLRSVRDFDTVARLDDGRCAVLLPTADVEVARKVVERIRKTAAAERVVLEGEAFSMALDVGVAAVGPETETVERLVEAAGQGAGQPAG